MYLLTSFFSPQDIFLFPLCYLVLFFIIRTKANRVPDRRIRSLYFAGFYFKTLSVFGFTLITHFYFRGGDTNLFYQASKDLRTAIDFDISHIWTVLVTNKIDADHPLAPFFIYDNFEQDITYNYMISATNFMPGKLALIPSYLFNGSYLCINMCFGFFALGGAIRLFKAFIYFYPKLWRELAVACIFLPGVAFWSSGLLKDTLSFGCIGYILYGLVKIIFKKEDYFSSGIVIIISTYLLINIKIYILMALAIGIVIWIFAEINKIIPDKTLRRVFSIMTFAGSIAAAYVLLNYLGSVEGATEYKLDTLMENAESQRQGYAAINQQLTGDSHFRINTSNPVSLFLNSIVATFFRPFLWEVNSPVAILSALESAIFLLITISLLIKAGVGNFFRHIFSDGRILMSFIFAIVFAFAVGSSTANFGALSRYKIPATPFYMIVIVLLFYKAQVPLPRWFNSIINFAVPKN